MDRVTQLSQKFHTRSSEEEHFIEKKSHLMDLTHGILYIKTKVLHVCFKPVCITLKDNTATIHLPVIEFRIQKELFSEKTLEKHPPTMTLM